ncbi:ABC transporter substrate-binding protein [Microbacterium sp. ET2]|uniref:ABC transporter substrate-binding protein n=1 Tax=Microbacterium albipurpureum TaxID=3050384 RepID=UPI00259D0D2E|nr:ABC transporter substrate-binding protein [Microbacterium sp. ET2 (Ac-2212)]WJL96953.1 ABC transporter substrate-binding protein [Microbacterium sp. ET2 (Ac-2212)]
MHTRKHLLTAAAVTGLLVMSGCAGGQGSSTETQTLRYGAAAPLASFAPWEARWAGDVAFLQPVYDTLLRTSPDGEIEAGLATDWSWNDSLTELTMTLRDDVTFSDGESFTAEVAAENLIRFRDGTSDNASFLTAMESAEAVDDATLRITLTQPDPAFLVYLSQNAGLQGSPAMWDSADAQTDPVGSGPYELDQSQTVVGSSYVFEKRDDYWDPESVHYDEIVVNVYNDATALVNALKGGQVDVSASNTPTQIPDAEAAGYSPNLVELNWAGFLLTDRDGTINPAMGDVRVRQAINHSLDRESLVQALAGGYGTPTTQVFSVNSDAYVPELDERYPYDIEKAKELLAEAGYPDGFTLIMPRNSFVPDAEFAIYAEQLAAAGITVEWEQTGEDLFPKMLGGTWAAFPFQLQSDPTAWQTMQLSMLPYSTWNTSHVENAELSALAAELQTAQGAEAEAVAQEVNEWIVEQAWFSPSYRVQSAFFSDADTQVVMQSDNIAPYLWNIQPK